MWSKILIFFLFLFFVGCKQPTEVDNSTKEVTKVVVIEDTIKWNNPLMFVLFDPRTYFYKLEKPTYSLRHEPRKFRPVRINRIFGNSGIGNPMQIHKNGYTGSQPTDKKD